MPSPLPVHNPEDDNVVLQIVDSNVHLDRWKEYTFNSNFLIPTDAFSFTVAGDQINARNRAAIIPGANVRCTVNGSQQIDARIDSVEYRVSRSGGVDLVISGRDKLAALIDSGIDPNLKFNPQMTLLEFLAEVFGPFGFSQTSFTIDNEENVGVLSKNVHGTKTSKGGKKPGRALKNYVLHQLRPYPNEGAFAFAARVCQRFGLWLWLSGDGKNIIASKPRYDQAASYSLLRQFGGANNIEEGTVSFDMSEQPSIIIADGFSGGSEFGHSRLRAYAENPILDVDNSAVIKKYKKAGATKLTIPFTGKKIKSKVMRPVYLHDDEAKNLEQLQNFVLREMSLRLRRSLAIHLTVKGHQQNNKNWAVDTVCRLDDDVANIHEDLWVLSRTFKKSRNGGTATDIELIRKNSLTF